MCSTRLINITRGGYRIIAICKAIRYIVVILNIDMDLPNELLINNLL